MAPNLVCQPRTHHSRDGSNLWFLSKYRDGRESRPAEPFPHYTHVIVPLNTPPPPPSKASSKSLNTIFASGLFLYLDGRSVVGTRQRPCGGAANPVPPAPRLRSLFQRHGLREAHIKRTAALRPVISPRDARKTGPKRHPKHRANLRERLPSAPKAGP